MTNLFSFDKIKIITISKYRKFAATVLANGNCLLDDIVCNHRFDEKSGNYTTSEIKEFIESEEFMNLIF